MDAPANSPRPTIRMACGAGIPSQRRQKTSNGPLGGGSLGFRVLMPVVYGRATALDVRQGVLPSPPTRAETQGVETTVLLPVVALKRQATITRLHTINSVSAAGPRVLSAALLRTLFTVKIFPEKYEYEKHGPPNATHTRPLTPSQRPARTRCVSLASRPHDTTRPHAGGKKRPPGRAARSWGRPEFREILFESCYAVHFSLSRNFVRNLMCWPFPFSRNLPPWGGKGIVRDRNAPRPTKK